MKHVQLEINISDWVETHVNALKADLSKVARSAVIDAINYFVERGYRSLEREFAELLGSFTSVLVDQSNLPDHNQIGSSVYRGIRDNPTVFTTCLKKDNTLLFIDIQPFPSRDSENIVYFEVDIFSFDDGRIAAVKDEVFEEVRRCYGLTKQKDELLRQANVKPRHYQLLLKSLKINEPLSELLFQRLRERADREILIELKKRGSILERDLCELNTGSVKVERVKSLLDYFSGDEYRLIDRKFAIVCNQTKEIIFLLRNKEDLEKAKGLECPKCSKKIEDETVFSYYERTEKLRELLDGSRWMPLLVRDAFIKAGVVAEDIHTEVKYGEDEIDLLILYLGRVIMIELKDRPASLNDAYKLSAKTSRLENMSMRSISPSAEDEVAELFDAEIYQPSRVRNSRGMFIPIVISTFDIAKDARDLLIETKDTARFLENCEGKIEAFAQQIIDDIENIELRRRIIHLTSTNSGDSIGNLAAAQIETSFSQWSRQGKDT